MNILIGRGIKNFTFGQTEDGIAASLGLPDKKYTDDFGDIFTVYNTLQTTFKFEEDNDYKLGWIETSNINTRLFEFSPWEIEKDELISSLIEILAEQPEVEDYGNFESATYYGSWLELQFEYNRLKQINFGVLFDEQENPLWPTS